MTGFDEQAKQAILADMKNDEIKYDTALMGKVIDNAFLAELDYMRSVGIINKNGEFADGDYDDDDAFDFITDAVSRALPKVDPYKITDYLEYYCEYHDRYLQDNGLLEWL